jgi:hypothetical protein
VLERVEQVQRPQRTSTLLQIGGVEVSAYDRGGGSRALRVGHRYRVFYWPHRKALLSVEPAE